MKNVFAVEVARLARQGRRGEAIGAAKRNLEASNGDAAAWSAFAHALILDGDFEEAERAAETAVAAAPAEPAFQFLLARIKYGLGKFESAVSHAGQAYAQSGLAGSTYYQESAALIAAAGFAQLGDGESAQQAMAEVRHECVVLAGTRITKGLVLELIDRLRGSRPVFR